MSSINDETRLGNAGAPGRIGTNRPSRKRLKPPEVAPTQPKRSATPATPRRVVPASSEDLRSRLYGEPGGATAQLRLLDVFVAHASPDRAQDALEGLIEQPLDGDDRGRVLRDGTILRLGALGSPGADAFLLALAATTESPATDRIAALQSLASRGVGEDAEPVVRAIALRDEEPVVRRAAERVLEVSTRLAVASRDGARARPPR